MRVCFITTLNTNIGDDFVREGIRALLDPFIKYEPWLLNKHTPERCVSETGVDLILDADVVIQCGAPVYWNLGVRPGQKCSNANWIEPLWRMRAFRTAARRPVLNLSAGACQTYSGAASEITSDGECREFIERLKACCRVTTVRDQMAADVHSELGLKAELLPCTSIHSWRRSGVKAQSGRSIALNFMPLGGHYDLDGRTDRAGWAARCVEIERLVTAAGHRPLFIAHDRAEVDFMSRLFPGKPVAHSDDYHDYFEIYAQCRGGIVNRVHGAMLLAGKGAPAVVIGNDSRTRTVDEMGLPRYDVALADPAKAVEDLLAMLADPGCEERLRTREQENFERHQELVKVAVQKGPSPSRSGPRVLVLQSGGFGDVVLTATLIGALKKASPHSEVALAVRSDLSKLPGLFPAPPDEVVPFDLHPHAWAEPKQALSDALEPVAALLDRHRGSRFVSATFRPIWFDYFAAALVNPQEAVVSNANARHQPAVLEGMLARFGLVEAGVRCAPFSRSESEVERYRRLAEFLTKEEFDPPAWTPPDAGPWLASAGLKPRQYVVCFAFANSKVPVKHWPVKKFLEVLNTVAKPAALPVVFAGSVGEREQLEAAASGFSGQVRVLAGGPSDVRTLAGVIAHARAYLGNDTGPMHLASAYGVPGVSIYGGGHWPSYRPWSPGSTALVHTLPCFDCDWDCVFGRGLCVERVPVAAAVEQFRIAIERPHREPLVIETSTLSPEESGLIHLATVSHRRESELRKQISESAIILEERANRQARMLTALKDELDLANADSRLRAQALEDAHREIALAHAEAEKRLRALEHANEVIASRRSR